MARRSRTNGMLTARQVSQMLNVHINTVRRWDVRGVLKAYRVGPRGDRRFSREDVALFLAEK
jgi:excisionase family DNA binding protein